VAGVVESTSGGFKFPDGSIQTSAIAGGGSYIQNTTGQQAGANFNIAGSGIIGASLGVGVAAEGVGRVTVLDSSKSYGIHVATLKVGSTGIFIQGGETGVYAGVGETGVGSTAILGVSGGAGKGVQGESQTGTGVKGVSNSGVGVAAQTNGTVPAIEAFNSRTSGFSDGLKTTTSSGDAVGIWALNLAAGGTAGRFDGNVAVNGTLTKSGGSFKIDHPLDPENQYLSHSFVESPDMMNIYNGNVTTGADGSVEVTLPSWFQALNEEFRYQLTCIGTFAQAIVAEEIRDNRFVIKTSLPRVKVSWQVTGIRRDPWAQQHRIPVEETKPDAERGFYLHRLRPAGRTSTASARSAEVRKE
jgi:hypothetical protein